MTYADNHQNQGGDTSGSVLQDAKQLSSNITDQAKTLGAEAMDALKGQAAAATETAKDLAKEAKEKLEAAVATQKGTGADYVANLADVVKRAGREFQADLPQAAEYIGKAATQISSVSEAIRNKDMAQIVSGVQDFARKQPTAFFGLSLFAGFVAIRFLKTTAATDTKSGGV
jgi:hypothetical protein